MPDFIHDDHDDHDDMDNYSQTIAEIVRHYGQLTPSESPGEEDRMARRLAAVALVIRNNGGDPELLIIERAINVNDPWSGHLALPGGRIESSDADLIDTVIRETREEVSLDLDRTSSIIGQLTPLRPVSPRLPPITVSPFIALAPEQTDIALSPEVARAFWTSLRVLKSDGRCSSFSMMVGSAKHTWPAYNSDRGPIWGITERIITDFLSRLELKS